MPIMSAAGSRFYISDAPIMMQDADFVADDFTSTNWVEVKETRGIGVLVEQAEERDRTTLGLKRRRYGKGLREGASLEVTAFLDPNDAGQQKVLEAEASDADYGFRIVYDDAPATGAAPTPSERIVVGLLFNAGESVEGPDQDLMLNASIRVNSNMVRIAAATGD